MLMFAKTPILLLGPKIILLICGTINPNKLIIPTAATAEAVINVASPTKKNYILLGFTPTAIAS